MKRLSLIILVVVVVFICAKLVNPWQSSQQYADLLPSSAQQLLAQHAALKIDIFAEPDSAAAQLVHNFLTPVLTHLTDAEVNYLDLEKHRETATQLGIQKQGEMVIYSGDASFQLNTLSYETFFNGLKRLNQTNDRWVVFLDGLNGQSFQPNQSNSYSDWLSAMQTVNYSAVVLNWQAGLNLPASAQLIVLPAPRVSLDQSQITWLAQQVERGVSVWWLTDPKITVDQPLLALMFDVLMTETYHQDQLILKQLPKHPINQDFDRPLDLYEVMPFVTGNDPVWLNDQGEVLSASQELPTDAEDAINPISRLLVSGDSDFLTNQYLHSGGNLEMSFRLLDWLLQHENRIDLPSIGLGETQIHYTKSQILTYAALMLIVIPLLFLLVGLGFWYKSSKASK